MAYWIFQFNPKRFRWFDWIRLEPENEQWLVSRYADEMGRGDKVAIWASGEEAGIYAIGELVGEPRQETIDPREERYFVDRSYYTRFLSGKSVRVKHLRRFVDEPILKGECSEDQILSGMSVMSFSQVTNYRLTEGQWNRILEILEQRREKGSAAA